MLTPLTRFHDWLTGIGHHLACLAIAVMLGSYTIEVFARYFLNWPQWWAAEAVSYSLCIGTFLMLPYVTWKKGHVAVTLIFDILPKPVAKAVLWFTVVMSVVACGLATWITFGESWRQYVEDIQMIAVKPVPKYLVSMFIPFGFASSTLHLIRHLDWRALNPAGPTGGQSTG